MGTTKLTRKEILSENPIHDGILKIVGFSRSQGKLIGAMGAAVLVIAAGVYFGMQYLERRDAAAQVQLNRGMEFYHGLVSSEAQPGEPYAKGLQASFPSEEAKYEAASAEFAAVVKAYGSSKPAVFARYYLGLCQLRMGQREEAVKTLEWVRHNTKDRTAGYLAKKVLAVHYLDAGNAKESRDILEGMIRDPQCDLPKEALKVDLARAQTALGSHEEALRILREARDEGKAGSLMSLVTQELERLEAAAAMPPMGAKQ